jgi:hypothetical protein
VKKEENESSDEEEKYNPDAAEDDPLFGKAPTGGRSREVNI